MMCDIKSVLIVEPVGQKCVDILIKHGIDVTIRYGLTEMGLIDDIGEFDAIIIQTVTKITIDVLLAAKKLKVIACAGAYFRNIDTFAALNRNIKILTAPRSSVLGACEFTCTLTMALARHIVTVTRFYRSGVPDRALYFGSELSGRVLALVGLSDVAKEVAVRMKAFGMKVIAFDPSVTEAECNALGVIKTNLRNMWPVADYIVLYTTPFESVSTYVTTEVINSCKKGVKIIVVGHSGVLQPRDIYEGLRSGQIGGAAFDLYDEYIDMDFLKYSIFQHPAVICTTHLGTLTVEAIERGGQEIAEQIVNLCKPGTYNTPLSIISGLDK